MALHLRFITQSQKEKKLKKKMKKKKSKRCIIKKLKHLRHAAKVKKAGMNHEEKLLARIERVDSRHFFIIQITKYICR